MYTKIRRVGRLAVVAAILVMTLVVPVGTASAAPNVDGDATPVDECGGATSLITLELSGGFEGCLYTDVITRAKFRPDGVYIEQGFETIVGCLDTADGEKCGTLSTSFEYVATFAPDGTQLTGGCTHPILSGTGDLDGASGVIVFRDDVVTGEAHFRGVVDLP